MGGRTDQGVELGTGRRGTVDKVVDLRALDRTCGIQLASIRTPVDLSVFWPLQLSKCWSSDERGERGGLAERNAAGDATADL